MLNLVATKDFKQAIANAIAKLKSGEEKIVYLQPEEFAGFFVSKAEDLADEFADRVVSSVNDGIQEYSIVCESLTGVRKNK